MVKLASRMTKAARKPLQMRFDEVRASIHPYPTQAAFAKLIGITRSAMNQIDLGKTQSIKAETAFAIEDKTGFAARWVATGYGPKRVKQRAEDRIKPEILQLAMWLGNLPQQQQDLLTEMFSKAVPDEKLGPDWKSS